jgi:regulator of replication initiation timing
LSKTKNKNRSEVEFLAGENRKLRKEVKQLRRMLEKQSPSQDVEESADSEDTMPKIREEKKTCSSCGKGHIKMFEIIGKIFEECDTCEYRKKL